jgi:hypothetical protein
MLCGSLPSSKIVLLRCAHDFSALEYLGDLVSDADAPLIDPGYDGFSAAELVETGNAIYLIVTPTVPGDGYRGCLVMIVTDLEAAAVARSDGTPIVFESVFGTVGSFHGACGYAGALSGSGIIYSEFFPGDVPEFRLFGSHKILD